MKKKTCGLFGIVVIAVLVSGQVWAAQIVSKVEDASVALRVKNGYTGTVTWVVGTDTTIQTNVITCDGIANTFKSMGTTNNTIVKLSTNVSGSATNAVGAASLTVNAEPSLAADSVVGTLLPGTYTAVAGAWLEVLWDTSACLHYDLYLPSRTYQAGVSAYVLGTVQGIPGGTGKVTASIYKAGVLIARKIETSPVYVNPATLLVGGTNVSTNTLGVVDDVTLDWVLNMPFSGTEAVIVRAARATTATTGVLDAVIPNP